jgi:2-keto-4-pentenoate hydratase/2-oxohepta-3-ene-1,7-dioic acid hydratase in catechol pathway
MADKERSSYARVQGEDGRPRWVIIEGSVGRCLSAAPYDAGQPSGETAELGTLLCPVVPSKIIGVGRNYRAHAAELGNDVPSEPLLFLKPPSSLVGPNAVVRLPAESERVEHEGELGVVIGRRCRNAPAEQALEYVFGYTAVCDITARDLQRKDGQWTRAKGFDGFCPAGPYIVTSIDPSDLRVLVTVNGEVRQDGRTRDMIFGVPELIAYISAIMTLEPGDLISTGTPQGVAPLRKGDRVAVALGEIGALNFSVESA